MKKKNKNKYITDIVCATLVIGIFGGVAIFNLCQTDRPTVSEEEKRTLATMPALTWHSLTDGSFFEDTALFVSDTFIGRDKLVGLSKKLDTLRGVGYSVDGGNEFAILTPQGGQTAEETGDDELSSKLAEALDALNNQNAEETRDETEPEKSDVPDDGEKTMPKTEVLPNGNIREVIGNGESGKIESITLSSESAELAVGSGTSLSAAISGDTDGATVLWSVSDKNIVSVTPEKNGGISIKGLAAGTCTVNALSGSKEAKCTVTVKSTSNPNGPADGVADFLPNGLFIYGDAVYTEGAYSPTNAKNYLDTALYYKTLFGDNVTVSVVVAPVSSMVIDNPQITSQMPDQKVIMRNMAGLCDPGVNFVDTYTEMYDHKDEYLFFKTDHHWTGKGAYYAYSAFAKSIGLTPTPLDGFDYVLKNEYYQGSMYSYTQDERVKNMYDLVEAYVPRKEHTMTITTRLGTTENYDSSIVSSNRTYIAFIAGDNPYTHINVPENPQDKNALVFKDSFGNAFVPYLCEHFGNIYVIDARYYEYNVCEKMADLGITDIVFVNNIQAANSPAWSKMYLSAVGVN